MLANKALVVSLNISQWTGRKLDKRATGTVEVSYATQSKVGNYTKKLLPGAKELEEISRLTSAIRVYFYTQTLPWSTDGARIISSKNYIDFVAAFRLKKAEFDVAVAAFISAYPSLIEAARAKLGTLFSETEYPTTEQLISAFDCDVTFMPVPSVSDFRVEILDSEKAAFLNRMRDVESNAMRECWARLYDTVAKAASRLTQPDAIIRDSLVDNIREICTLLPRLNIMDDPSLEAMRQEVERVASGISADSCRASITARESAAKSLADISSKMSAFMGGS